MNKKGLTLAFTTACISGLSIYLNKFGVKGIDSSIFTFSKNVIVALFLFSTLMFFQQDLNLKAKQWAKLVLIGLVGGSIPFLLFFKGLQLTSAISAAFIHKTMFVFITIFAVIFLKEKVDKKFFVGAILLLIGNAIFLKTFYPIFDYGSGLILLATLFWATENVISKHTLKELPSKVVAFGRMFFGSLFILGYLAFTDKLVLVSQLSFNQISWVLVTSSLLFLYVISWYESLRLLKASVASSVLLLGSVITTIVSLNFTLNTVVGNVLLVSGLMLTTKCYRLIKILNIEKLTS